MLNSGGGELRIERFDFRRNCFPARCHFLRDRLQRSGRALLRRCRRGIDLLQIVRENFPLIEIIMTSAVPDVDGAVRAIKLGASDFFTKDTDPDVLREFVRHAVER